MAKRSLANINLHMCAHSVSARWQLVFMGYGFSRHPSAPRRHQRLDCRRNRATSYLERRGTEPANPVDVMLYPPEHVLVTWASARHPQLVGHQPP